MTISSKAWIKYVNEMKKLDDTASDKVAKFITQFKSNYGQTFSYQNPSHMKALVNYSYGISTKFGEGATALACEMYDAIGIESGLFLEAAEPVSVATYQEVSKAMRGASAITENDEYISSQVGRLVKQAGADTILQNAKRDGAEFAWIPNGDTCAYCLTLASVGWQKAYGSAMQNGHAEHIHGNCDCQYAVRFNSQTRVSGYDPTKYLKMYYGADLDGEKPTAKNRLNALRREIYQQNKDEINAQKRSAYEKSKEKESSRAEEFNVN